MTAAVRAGDIESSVMVNGESTLLNASTALLLKGYLNPLLTTTIGKLSPCKVPESDITAIAVANPWQATQGSR
ncbi:hypothetical protein GCM10027361_01480 [Erwinia aphidicola]